MFQPGPAIEFGRIAEKYWRAAKRFFIGLAIILGGLVWFLVGSPSWSELTVTVALLVAYLIFECGGPVYVFVWLCRAFKDWLNKPSVCRKCGGTRFRIPAWWKPEMSRGLLSFGVSESLQEFSSPPPQECANCGELNYF